MTKWIYYMFTSVRIIIERNNNYYTLVLRNERLFSVQKIRFCYKSSLLLNISAQILKTMSKQGGKIRLIRHHNVVVHSNHGSVIDLSAHDYIKPL